MITSLKRFYHNHPWKSRLLLTTVLFIILLTTARLILSPGIIYASNHWLKQQGIDSSIKDINIDILDGTVSLLNAQGMKQGNPLFHIGKIEIHWQWKPLSRKTVTISHIELDRIKINIRHYDDKIIIGGVNIALLDQPGNKPVPANDKLSWATNLGEISLKRLDICYLRHNSSQQKSNADTLYLDYCIDIDEIQWQGSISYASSDAPLHHNDLPLSTRGDFTLNGIKLVDNRLGKKLLVSQKNALHSVTTTGLNKIHIEQLNMAGLSLLQRDSSKHSDAVRFQQLQIDDIRLNNLNNLSINHINVAAPGVYLVKKTAASWEYQQWIPSALQSDLAPGTEPSKPAADSSSSLKVRLTALTISDADLCYLEQTIDLYYCLTFNQLDWSGNSIFQTRRTADHQPDLDITANLELQDLILRNHTIDRNLLSVQTLKLDTLDITGTDTIKLNSLAIYKLKALQRSNKPADHTLAFDNLMVSPLALTQNKLQIDTITVNGLQSTVSKRRDGQWEYNKWLTALNTASPATSDTNKSSHTGNNSSKKAEFSIQQIKIETDKPLLFVDNSTKPAMNIGLAQLKLHIADLDSGNKNTDSNIDLFARTTRHGTIELKGTMQPFADKISFDTHGKLEGFDLRAATPATKKAIGHIIQSGQLDARLQLKADEGMLDSSIDLSLYHFRIKPQSLKDAEALDKKFGMPLDQTLVLLRDKDDSIHLSIPVTGNVENPDFDPMDAIITATSKAATVTLITFYTPYGLIYAGGNLAFNLATALNLDPVVFEPGSSELNTAGREQLNNIARLMTEKPQIHLTLCGVTAPQDNHSLFPDTVASTKDPEHVNDSADSETPLVPLDDKQRQVLETLARQRQINTKNYLVDEHSINHSRLILCAPEHKTDSDAIPSVEINI